MKFAPRFVLALLALCATNATAQSLRDFMEAPTPPFRAHLPAWTNPEVDRKGNLLVTFGSGTEHLLFVGHLDEIGYVITKINDDGTLSVTRRSGLDPNFEARPVMLYTNLGPVSGIITPGLVYLGTETKKATEDLGIKPGDPIMVPNRSADERTSCAAMLMALMRLDPSKVDKKITFAWTVDEEVGVNSARALAEKSNADYVFTVDTLMIRIIDPSGAGIDHRYSIPLLDQGDTEKISEIIHRLVVER